MRFLLCIVLVFLEFEKTKGDPCSEKRYTVLDDFRRSPTHCINPSERRLCDNRIKQDWYRLQVNGSDAQIPTTCVPEGCGTRAPIWLSPPSKGLPPPGKKSRTHACASFAVPGSQSNCCGLKFPIAIKNCGTYFVYRLRSTKGCDLAYCSEVIHRGCGVGQVYVLHLQKCVEILVQISKPKLHVKKYQDRVSVMCLFDVYNTTVSEHKPTFSVTWIRIRNGVSTIIKFKFISDTKDQVVLGKDVHTGDSVACEVMPVHQTKSKMSATLFLGIQLMEQGLVISENGAPQTLTFVSTVPLMCDKDNVRCKLDMVLTMKYPKDNTVSNVMLSRCLLQFQPNTVCQGIGCITQQVTVAMTPNLHGYKVKEVNISGYIYVDDKTEWIQDSVQAKIAVEDLPSASCYVTAGVFISSFQESISKLPRRGTYVLVKSITNEFEVQIRVSTCASDDLLCICGVAVYYWETRLLIDSCQTGDQSKDIFIQYLPQSRANMKIYEGRHGKLIYILLGSKAQLRIDLRQNSLAVTVQVSGYFTDKMSGLCGIMGNESSGDEDDELNVEDWRLMPGLSLFDNSELFPLSMTTELPECDCSRSSYQTSCPTSTTDLPQFLFTLKETTFYWLNQTKLSNQNQDYLFSGDFNDEEIVLKQVPSKDGQLANDQCQKMFATSGIAKTCLNKIKIRIDNVVNICVALATSYRNSTWIPEVLRLLENLCETNLHNNEEQDTSDINIEDIRQAILCPEGCYGNGMCTETGCFCYHGYTGIECLTRTEIITTSTLPTTTTTKSTAATTTSTTSTTTTTMTTTTIEAFPVTMVTCDVRQNGCRSVNVALTYDYRESPYQCHVILVQFINGIWESGRSMYTTMLRFVDATTVECMLPLVTNRGNNFANVYKVEIPDPSGNVLASRLVAVIDSLCQDCDIYRGCSLRPQTCYIDNKCYTDRSTNPGNKCLQCRSEDSTETWVEDKDHIPPLLHSNMTTIIAMNRDTVKQRVPVIDHELSDLTFSMTHSEASISKEGEFTWEVRLNSVEVEESHNAFVINVTDSCGAGTTFLLNVVVKPCLCLNGGLCDQQIVTKNRTDFVCTCNYPFTGQLCDTEINGCHGNPCFPGVSCTDNGVSYHCGECPFGYHGDGITCKKSCAADPCFPNVTCTDMPGRGFVCGACPEYYYGNGEECYRSDESACNNNVCSPLVSCEETPDFPGYRCGSCPRGYLGNGTVCQAFCFPPCTAGKHCVGPGVCECSHGYTGPGCTQAICDAPCQNGGICYQPNKCFCQTGFTGQYCETDLCPDGCLNGGSCLAANKCACLPGYRGHRCEIGRSKLNGGSCLAANKCACLPGYRGHRCEIESCSITCLNGGTCVGYNRCRCTPQYTGVFCHEPVCKPDCINNGVCVRPDVCYCPMGYYGPKCEQVFCYPPCKNDGKCLAGNQCECQSGFTGHHCESRTCLRNFCRNGGRCVGPNMCKCRAGWEGKYCRKPICHFGCQNGGFCYLPDRCHCQPGHWGPNCQFPSCYPPCAYGGKCTGPNKCTCQKYYTGKYCWRRKR